MSKEPPVIDNIEPFPVIMRPIPKSGAAILSSTGVLVSKPPGREQEYPKSKTPMFGATSKPTPVSPPKDGAFSGFPDEGHGGALIPFAQDNTKPTNPKDAIGVAKFPISTVPMAVIAEVGVAMTEGALKYGRHNYRAAGVRASIYIDASNRHISKFWDYGEDVDADSGLSHITKAIASLIVLRDGIIQGNWADDRPPPQKSSHYESLDKTMEVLIKKYPNPKAAITEKK